MTLPSPIMVIISIVITFNIAVVACFTYCVVVALIANWRHHGATTRLIILGLFYWVFFSTAGIWWYLV